MRRISIFGYPISCNLIGSHETKKKGLAAKGLSSSRMESAKSSSVAMLSTSQTMIFFKGFFHSRILYERSISRSNCHTVKSRVLELWISGWLSGKRRRPLWSWTLRFYPQFVGPIFVSLECSRNNSDILTAFCTMSRFSSAERPFWSIVNDTACGLLWLLEV